MSLCVFQMPQVLVKLKKYPQGDKVRLEGHLWDQCVSQWCCAWPARGNAPSPKNLSGRAAGGRWRWACASGVVAECLALCLSGFH